MIRLGWICTESDDPHFAADHGSQTHLRLAVVAFDELEDHVLEVGDDLCMKSSARPKPTSQAHLEPAELSAGLGKEGIAIGRIGGDDAGD